MMRSSHHATKFVQRALVLLLALFATAPVWAQSNVVSIEEHWELRLAQPDQDRSAPQTTMVVSPNGNVEGLHFLFTLNHSTLPQYEPGGMQVQVWDGSDAIETKSTGAGAFAYDDEVVHWVQRLSLHDGTLQFQVSDGQSETWGNFGGDELTVSQPTSLQSLNQYRPVVSLTESQVNYAENRVVSLTLTKLVWVTADGERHELNAPIPLDTSLDQ